MTVRVEVSSSLLSWARTRSGIDDKVWSKRFPHYEAWMSGAKTPTLKQVEEFAKRTYTPVGHFFLDEPPTEGVPIPDFHTVGDRPVAPTADRRPPRHGVYMPSTPRMVSRPSTLEQRTTA